MRSRTTAIAMGSERDIKSPCMACKKRKIACHSDCVDYGAYKKRLKDARAQMMERNRGDIFEDKYKFVSRDRIERKMKK